MQDENKRFESWSVVDCNDCSHWWDDSCSGVKKGSEKPCTAFIATRKVDIPDQIKRLKQTVKGLTWSVALLAFITGMLICLGG